MDVEKKPMGAELPPLDVVIRQNGEIVGRVQLPDPRSEFIAQYNQLNRGRGRTAEPQAALPEP